MGTSSDRPGSVARKSVRAVWLLLLVVSLNLMPAGNAPAVWAMDEGFSPRSAFLPAAGNFGPLVFAPQLSGGKPRNPTTDFKAETGRIYGYFSYRGLTERDTYRALWYQGGRLLFTQTFTLRDAFPNDSTPPQQGNLWVYINQEDGFTPDEYRLDLYLDDKLIQSGQFHVSAAGDEPLFTDVRFADARTLTADETDPLEVAYDFGSDTPIAAVWNHFNMDRAKSWGYRVSQLGEPASGETDMPWTGEADGRAVLSFDLPAQPGVYDFDLFIDGRWVTSSSASFTVENALISHVEPTFTDDFSDPTSGWLETSQEENSEGFASYYEDGRLVTEVGEPGGFSANETMELTDAVIEVEGSPVMAGFDMGVLERSDFEGYGYYGVIVREQDLRNTYAFLTTASGHYAVYQVIDGNARELLKFTKAVADLIPPGVETRRFRALLLGPVMRFYVNDRLICTITDAEWTTGRAGVVALATPDSVSISVAWDNWSVWEPGVTPSTPPLRASAEESTASDRTQPGRAATTTGDDSAVPSAIRLDAANWLPPRDATYGWWGVVPAGREPSDGMQKTNEEDRLELKPGRYDVYWVQTYNQRDKPLLIAADVEVGDTGEVTVRAASGIKLTIHREVPRLDSTYGWWGAVPTGGEPKDVVNWTSTDDILLLPPGRYDVYWVQGYDQRDRPMLLMSDFPVNEGQLEPLDIESGVRLEISDAVPKRDSTYGWWGAVKWLEPVDQLVNWTKTDEVLFLPPGQYDLFWAQGYDQRDKPLLLKDAVFLNNGDLLTLKVDSGARVDVSPDLPARDATYGWWGATFPGIPPDDKLVNWTKTDESILLMPGKYDFYWVQGYDQRDHPQLLGSDVKVTAGKFVAVPANSGARIDVSRDIPPRDATYGWWGAVVAGDSTDQLVNWTKTDEAILLTPGEYDFYWVQGYDQRDRPMLLASGVAVTEGELATIPARSGVQLDLMGRPRAPKSGGWWGLTPPGKHTKGSLVNWSTSDTRAVLLAPPGEYDVVWNEDSSAEPQVLLEAVVVEENRITEVQAEAPAS